MTVSYPVTFICTTKIQGIFVRFTLTNVLKFKNKYPKRDIWKMYMFRLTYNFQTSNSQQRSSWTLKQTLCLFFFRIICLIFLAMTAYHDSSFLRWIDVFEFNQYYCYLFLWILLLHHSIHSNVNLCYIHNPILHEIFLGF